MRDENHVRNDEVCQLWFSHPLQITCLTYIGNDVKLFISQISIFKVCCFIDWPRVLTETLNCCTQTGAILSLICTRNPKKVFDWVKISAWIWRIFKNHYLWKKFKENLIMHIWLKFTNSKQSLFKEIWTACHEQHFVNTTFNILSTNSVCLGRICYSDQYI